MAEHEAIAEGSVAVAERPDVTPAEKPQVPVEEKTPDIKAEKNAKKGKKKDDEEYEVEFETPFGKLEFEFEPKAKKEAKDREKRQKAELKAQKEAEKVAEKAAKRARAELEAVSRGRSKLPLIILGIVLVSGAVVLAYWLFARPVPEDRVPDEFLAEPETEPEPEPAAFIDKMRYRVRNAVRAGRRASYETQEDERKRFEEMTQSP